MQKMLMKQTLLAMFDGEINIKQTTSFVHVFVCFAPCRFLHTRIAPAQALATCVDLLDAQEVAHTSTHTPDHDCKQ